MSATWHVRGDYFETCNCDYLCPCITSHLQATPTHGHCDAALVFHVEEGVYDGISLDDLNFAVLLHTPDAMGAGNWGVGVITDERATQEQQQALAGIASGQAGGPMAALGPLVGEVRGVEARPIHYERQGMSRSVSIPNVLDQACDAVAGIANPQEPVTIENTVHPANHRLALAKATRSHVHIFGIDWDDTSGKNNAHVAPFQWKSD